MISKIVSKAAADPLQFAFAAGIVIGVVYFVVKHAGVAAAKSAVGLVTGDNALTHGTPYENTGVVGTVAAAANRASGGVLQSIGEGIGGWVYDLTHKEYDPQTGLQSAQKTVRDGWEATNNLWGPVGSVELRSF